MIEVDQVHKSFGKVRAVQGVSFTVPKGSVVGVLGPNGAGKSTTIRMITGILPPDRGSVRVDGLDSIDQSMKVRRRLGYLPESNPLYPEMRVIDFLNFRGRLFSLPSKQRKAAVEHAIERCWLAEVSTRRVGHLSKGYRQRVGLAAAMLHDPPVLILDEPTSGLDPAQIAETRELIRELAGDHTMLIVSHILPEVERSCDRLLIFARGRIQADGSADELLRDLAQKQGYALEVRSDGIDPKAYLESSSAVERAEPDPSGRSGDGWHALRVVASKGVSDPGAAIGEACRSANMTIRSLRPATATLEALYIRLVEQADKATAKLSAEVSDSEGTL
ncbi:MAG: ABC transporter ATP-binding protein [Phycisphaerales bacterium]